MADLLSHAICVTPQKAPIMHTTALVGCAHIHTPDFIKRLNNREDVTVKWVWDHDRERAEQSAQKTKSQTVSELSDIFGDEDVQSVVICSETNRHESLVLDAVSAKKHLFVEKPLGTGSADSMTMAKTIDDAGVIFQTGFFHRTFAVNQFLKAQIDAGSFGKITRIGHSNRHAGSLKGWFDNEWRWMADPSQAGVGAFGDMGAHSTDLLLWLMGDVEKVTASIDVATGRYGDCDEYGEGLLKFKNGAIGRLEAGWVSLANPITHLISGTEGQAYVHNRQLYFESQHVEGADGQSVWTDLPDDLPHAFDLFLDAVNGEANVPLVTTQEASRVSQVIEAMYTAHEQATWIEIE